jgi:lysine-specific demethylase 8
MNTMEHWEAFVVLYRRHASSLAIDLGSCGGGGVMVCKMLERMVEVHDETVAPVACAHCWEVIHVGHWKDVQPCWFKAYAFCAFAMGLCAWRNGDWMEALRWNDMILIVGHGDCHPIAQATIESIANQMDVASSARMQCAPWPQRIPLPLPEPLLRYPLTTSTCVAPSLIEFDRDFVKQGHALVIRGYAAHWAALSKWTDCKYLQSTLSHRLVPVEVGSSYAHDDNWSQKLMTFGQFYRDFVSDDKRTDAPIGYVAQTQLLKQVPALMRDILVPDYCCMGDGGDVSINAWFGPEGTVSPLHTDPRDNVFCQLAGSKVVLLFHASQTTHLYPYSDGLVTNTSRVDAGCPDVMQFPLFPQAEGSVAVLRAGDALFIPRGMWHYCKALQPSWSCSFWF